MMPFFAGTEQDLMVGIHYHMHLQIIPPSPAPPFTLPMMPSFHPSLGPIRDKLAGTVKCDNRKAAKTGSKAKILIPPHLPIVYFSGIGPFMAGMPKETTGLDQIFMGAGLGAHPFGGLKFVVVEGKPGACFLSYAMECISVGPIELVLPALPNLLLIPTRGPTVFYFAPLAIDLCVIAVALVQALFDYICDKIKIPILKDIVGAIGDGVTAGMEDFFEQRFEKDPPATTAEAFQHAARTAAYTFTDSMVDKVTNRVTGAIGDHLPGPLKTAWDKLGVKDKVAGGLKDLAHAGLDKATDGDYSKFEKEKKAKDAAGKATAPDPLGAITTPAEKLGGLANKAAVAYGKSVQGAAKEEKAAMAKNPPDLAGAAAARQKQQDLYDQRVSKLVEDPIKNYAKDEAKKAAKDEWKKLTAPSQPPANAAAPRPAAAPQGQGNQAAPQGGNQPAPQGGGDQPAPQGDQPAPQGGGDQPAPQGDQPAPQGDQPAPQGDQPAPQGDQPAPQGDQPAPQGDQPAPQGDQPAPQGDQPAPEGDQPAPQGDQPAPQGDQPAPQGDQPAPEGDQPAPQGDPADPNAPANQAPPADRPPPLTPGQATVQANQALERQNQMDEADTLEASEKRVDDENQSLMTDIFGQPAAAAPAARPVRGRPPQGGGGRGRGGPRANIE